MTTAIASTLVDVLLCSLGGVDASALLAAGLGAPECLHGKVDELDPAALAVLRWLEVVPAFRLREWPAYHEGGCAEAHVLPLRGEQLAEPQSAMHGDDVQGHAEGGASLMGREVRVSRCLP